jgi:hypothetical protein
MWQNKQESGCEYCTLTQTEQGFQLLGFVLQAIDNQPGRIEYQVVCDQAWRTRAVMLDCTMGASQRTLQLTVDDQQRWWQAGSELAECAGLIDIDLAVTPSTNTLPIRRLQLAVGENSSVTAAWVRFPELTIQPLAQRYTRLAEYRYQYLSIDHHYQAELEVDELGLVIQYGDWFERVATQAL